MKNLYCFLFIISAIVGNAQTLFVDINNNSGIENGSAGYPYKSLYDGINAAQVNDTLFIKNGIYNASPGVPAFILKDGVVIMGEDSAQTIINGNFENLGATMNQFTKLTNLRCNNVYLANGDGTAKIVVNNCSINQAGFSSASGYTFMVENCSIEKGISNSSGNNYLFIRNNVIRNGQIADSGGALEGVEAHIIENNDITYFMEVAKYGILPAVVFANSQSVTIKNNRIKANGKCSGIVVSSNSPTNIIDNIIICDKPTDLINDWFYGINTSSGEGVVTGNTIVGGTVGYQSSSGATEFANNNISHSHIGFKSIGGEEVFNNKITKCSGHGVIDNGFRGPFYNNIVMDNDSAGIIISRWLDIGGGHQNSPGNNIFKNNGWYDLVFPPGLQQNDTLLGKYNTWDHNNLEDILQFDILNQSGTALTININSFNSNIHKSLGSKIYVDKNNHSGFEIGTEQYPYSKIEDALENTIDTDTVIIAAGTYVSDSLLIQNNIEIIGAGKENTWIEGTFYLSSSLDTFPAVEISKLNCTNVVQSNSGNSKTPLTIQNCIIQNYADTTASVSKTGNLTFNNSMIQESFLLSNRLCQAFRKIINCEIVKNASIEIIASKGRIEVRDCTIGDKLSITTVSNQDSNIVLNNTINDSLIVQSAASAGFIKMNDNSIEKTVTLKAVAASGFNFSNNTIKNGNLIGEFSSLANSFISKNKLLNGGIKFESSSAQILINDNEIKSMGQISAIDFKSRSGGKITGNSIDLPSLYYSGKPWTEDTLAICGIKVKSVSFNGIFNNIIRGGEYGIQISSVVSQINNCTISAAGTGIYMETISSLIDSNLVRDNTGDGIIISAMPGYTEYGDSISARTFYNTISSNGGTGLRIFKNATIENNALFGNQNYDLYVETPAIFKPTILAQQNLWDHENIEEIDLLDIYDDDENVEKSEVIFNNFIRHPKTPELISPNNASCFPGISELHFLWKEPTNTDSFEFRLATDSLFSDVISTETIIDTIFTFSTLEPFSNYFWQVRSKKLGFFSNWSETRFFTTFPPTEAFKTSNLALPDIIIYPNPSRENISISYRLQKNSFVSLKIFNGLGNEIKTLVFENQPAGNYQIHMNGGELKSGIYFCHLRSGVHTVTKKIVFSR